MTADEIIHMLRQRFAPREFAFIEQVRNGTGWAKRARTADAIAMSLFPSKGLHLYGFEVKVSRSDWIKELKDLEKSDGIGRYCDYWVIAAPDGIVRIEELPEKWGLMVPKKDKMHFQKNPVKMESQSLDKLFIGALLRQAQKQISSEARIRLEIDKAVEDEYKRMTRMMESESRIMKNRISMLQKRIEELEKSEDRPFQMLKVLDQYVTGENKQES